MITNFMVLHGVVTKGHFFELSKLFNDPVKIKKLQSMPETHCYEIQAASDFNLTYLFKNNSIHVQPASHSTGNVKILITNLYGKDLPAFNMLFSSSNVIECINSVINIEKGYFKTWRFNGCDTALHGFIDNDMLVISSISPNDLAKAQAQSKKYNT